MNPGKPWKTGIKYDAGRRRSELCKAADIHSDWYKRWCAEICETPRMHRKQWEYAYILQALYERNCIKPGNKGLAFAVGSEPLPSVFAKHGCTVLATDINPAQGEKLGWTHGDQLCFGVDQLNTRDICDDKLFKERVSYRSLDMNHIPDDVTGYDFNWSSCSFEHLGSIDKGLAFLGNQLRTLKPGGWAIHTTEYNLSSNTITVDHDRSTVIFRQKDIDHIVQVFRDAGHFVEEVDYSMGWLPEDFHVDIEPYTQDVHLRLQLGGYVVTSIGLIIQNNGAAIQKKKKFFFF